MKKIAIFASHNGSHTEPIYEAIDAGRFNARLSLIVTNNSNANVLQKAKAYKIPHYIINTKRFDDPDTELLKLLQKYQIELIVLSGYMKKIPKTVTCNYEIINSHPSLLPKYGGKGMYGRFVHEAVINNNETYSGLTIHKVNAQYDDGEILLQRSLKLAEKETPDSLQEKIKAMERKAIVEALEQCLN
jgi:phosphoribosylglycinamide formyltransferase-1